MKHGIIRHFLLSAATALIAAPGSANDSSAVLEAGGLRLTRDAPVEIVREDLFIAADRIEVNYVFRAADDVGTSTIVAFPLPEYDHAWLGMSAMGGMGETVESRSRFELWVDGAPVTPQIELKALRNGIDVTEALTGLSITPGTLDYDRLMQQIRALPDETRRQLVQADLLEDYGGGEYAPEWTVKATYYWLQHFPPGRDVAIRHVYQPVAGMFIIADPELRDFDPDAFCMSGAERQGVKNRMGQSGHGAALGSEVRYVLSTGANRRGPIGTFRLTIDKGAPDAMVSLCFDGLKKIAPTRFEAVRTGFTPDRDLQVLFVTAP